jgi:hypothetical protein
MKTTLGILVVILLAFGAYWALNKDEAEPQLVACTMEALLCPDGSGVGRQGPDCHFSACEYRGPYTGILTQEGGDFRLNMAAPSDLIGQGTYSMPVRFSRISNAVAEFVGKSVVVTGTFSTGSTLEVETIVLK